MKFCLSIHQTIPMYFIVMVNYGVSLNKQHQLIGLAVLVVSG